MQDAPRAQATLFLITAVVLAFEVSLTRICSVLLQYHISFAVVSFAVLGLGLGGFAAHVAVAGRPQRIPVVANGALLAIAPTMLLALAVLLRTPFASAWPVLLALVLPVFACTGAFQALVFAQYAGSMGRMYAADLAGGALGALLAVVAVDALGGPVQTILLLALVAALTVWLMQPPPRLAIVVGVLAFGCVLLQGVRPVFEVDYRLAPGKLIHTMMQPQGALRPQLRPELQRWDAYSRVDVLDVASAAGYQRMLFIDGETPTSMLPMQALTPGRSAIAIDTALPALPYRLLQPQSVLSIGSGGGYDVRVALHMGARRIDAVEINAGVLDVVAAAREFHGDVYGQPGVTLHHSEGRQFARATDDTYDLVIMLLAQSLAGNLKEYALSENYLYTREAFGEYLDVLTPDGSLALVLNNAVFVRKLARTAIEVLQERGVDGRECIAVVTSPDESPYDQLLLVRKRPFDAAERQRLAAEIDARGYRPRHLPHGAGQQEVQYGEQELAGSARERLRPATDDRPFFFHVDAGVPAGLLPLVWVSAAMLLLAWGLVAFLGRGGRSDVSTQGGRGTAWSALYFTTLGVAFMAIEVLALQKTVLLVGFPTLNLAVVLSVFLLAAGLGSAASTRLLARFGSRVLWVILLVLCALLLALSPVLDSLLAPFDPLSLTLRCIVLAAVLFPFAFLMGMPFPLGVRALPEAERRWIPVFWGLNGVASVLGSTLAVTLALLVGLRFAMLLGIGCYGLALLLAIGWGRRASTSTTH